MCSNRSNTIIESYSSNRCIRTIRTSGLNFQRYKRTCNAKGITWLHPVLSWQLMVLTSLLCPYPFLLAGQMFRCLSSLCLCDSSPDVSFWLFLQKKDSVRSFRSEKWEVMRWYDLLICDSKRAKLSTWKLRKKTVLIHDPSSSTEWLIHMMKKQHVSCDAPPPSMSGKWRCMRIS